MIIVRRRPIRIGHWPIVVVHCRPVVVRGPVIIIVRASAEIRRTCRRSDRRTAMVLRSKHGSVSAGNLVVFDLHTRRRDVVFVLHPDILLCWASIDSTAAAVEAHMVVVPHFDVPYVNVADDGDIDVCY
jgi:hypothetical protein